MQAVVFMDDDKNARHAANVFSMWLRGAELSPTQDERSGEAQDAREAALKYWARHPAESLMIFGLDAAPEPYPAMAREFASTIGRECLRQVRLAAKRPPDLVVARGGDNADALGLFPPMVAEQPHPPGLRRAAARGRGCLRPLDPARHSCRRTSTGWRNSILEGMEYPAVCQHWLRGRPGRVRQGPPGISQEAIRDLSYFEGITPAIEPLTPWAGPARPPRR